MTPEPIVRSDGLAVVGGGLHLPDTALAAARAAQERERSIQQATALLGADKVAEIIAKADEIAARSQTPWGVAYNSLLNAAAHQTAIQYEGPDGLPHLATLTSVSADLPRPGETVQVTGPDGRTSTAMVPLPPAGPNRAERRVRSKANAKRVARVTTASQRDAATAGRSGRALHRKGEIQFFAQSERRKPS